MEHRLVGGLHTTSDLREYNVCFMYIHVGDNGYMLHLGHKSASHSSSPFYRQNQTQEIEKQTNTQTAT